MKFDIKVVLEDMKVAIEKKKFDIIPYQLNLIYLFLETIGYEATKYFPFYLTIKGELPDEIKKYIEKLKEKKSYARIRNGLSIYYSKDCSEILVEEIRQKRKVANYLLIRVPK